MQFTVELGPEAVLVIKYVADGIIFFGLCLSCTWALHAFFAHKRGKK